MPSAYGTCATSSLELFFREPLAHELGSFSFGILCPGCLKTELPEFRLQRQLPLCPGTLHRVLTLGKGTLIADGELPSLGQAFVELFNYTESTGVAKRLAFFYWDTFLSGQCTRFSRQGSSFPPPSR